MVGDTGVVVLLGDPEPTPFEALITTPYVPGARPVNVSDVALAATLTVDCKVQLGNTYKYSATE